MNVASRVEASGLDGEILITEETWKRVRDTFEQGEHGEIQLEGAEMTRVWLVKGRRSPTARDQEQPRERE